MRWYDSSYNCGGLLQREFQLNAIIALQILRRVLSILLIIRGASR